MTIWALADLHLAFSDPAKKMDFFGGAWENYTDKIEKNWLKTVAPTDLVLLPGDISWALYLKDAVKDLEWIDKLPGTKVMIKGNHDLWWESLSKVKKVLPPSLHIIQNDIFTWNGWEIGGARLWDTPEYSYSSFVTFRENPRAKTLVESKTDDDKIFLRELARLELSLKLMKGPRRIAMVHYPPISSDLLPSQASALLEKFQINHCVFGHIHQVDPGKIPLGQKNGITYQLVAADYVEFTPQKVV